MNSNLLLIGLACLLASCASKGKIEAPDAGTPGIIIAQEETREHYWGKVVFPAGLYKPEAKSQDGIYYAAPTPLNTGGVIRGGKEHGGLFINKAGSQGMWIGQPGYQLQLAPGTVMGSWGVETPILRAISVPIVIKKAQD